MSTAELRRQIKKRIDSLPPDRLRSAADFLDYLGQHIDQNAFDELIRSRPPLANRLKQAEADIAAGRLTPASGLRRK